MAGGTKLGRHKQLRKLDNLAAATTLRAVPAKTPGPCIFVKTLSGSTITVHGLSHSDTVASLEEAIEGKEGVPVDQQKLSFAGKRLQPSHTLGDFGIGSGSTVHMVLSLCGGRSMPLLKIPFADVSRSDAMQRLSFDPDAPDWRTACEGLNMEGYCRNRACKARNKLVISMIGMNAFTLGSQCACPECGADVTPVTCGFYACTWMYEGAKTDGMLMRSPWHTASDDLYHRVNEHGNMASWSRLVLVAKPIASDAQDKDKDALPSECAVCLMPLAAAEHTVTRACGHRYYATCLQRWQESSIGATCTACRTELHGVGAAA
ncbi:hypothetical protein JKP88DRAFT_171493 [Tribonema minus]|uniref:Uncharacterized protein n=1 Tax=Tribonema minus TaxID=303371 RepID=A0A836C8N2_9STRA|nr:hypothetical protein JKP88DRAFT_171493 [Tribonema minus]